ncbi:MAG: hypothetical protein WBC18_06905 [Ottowia sp.]|uniref:hypothetical protein n=1 Tax=unclassified Ottowia TaxID=2645081 RepID=UPI003C2FDF7B
MQAKNIALVTLLAATFAGSAFAAQPESGEGPLFLNEPVVASTLTRAEVTKQAIANPPATNATVFTGNIKSQYTRAEVRKQTREAIAHGYRVQSGDAG